MLLLVKKNVFKKCLRYCYTPYDTILFLLTVAVVLTENHAGFSPLYSNIIQNDIIRCTNHNINIYIIKLFD